ncbi:hypothetical protein JCM5350_000975 [Sporobolomyces pararoseus]
MSTAQPWVPIPEIVPQLLDLRGKITANKRFIVAWLAVVWFDTFATLPDEKLLWNSRWSLLKVTFLLNRWLSPCAQSLWAALVFAIIPTDVCSNIFWLQPASITLVMVLSGVLMAIRVYALYSTKKVLALLAAMVTLEIAAMSAAASQFKPLKLPPNFGLAVDLQGCIATGEKINKGHGGGLVALFWAAPLLFDTAILILTLYNILVVNKRARRLPVLSHILRDGLTFFICISVANLINVALFAEKDIVLQNFFNPTSIALASIMSSRLVTSLRKLDGSQRLTQSRTSIMTSTLKPWSPPMPHPSSQPFDSELDSPSSHRRRQASEGPSTRRKSEEFASDEERTAGGIGGGGDEEGENEQLELSPMGSSLHFRTNSTSAGTRRRHRQPRPPNQAIVGLERLGLISPSTAVDISRPMPLETGRAPFSDVIPLDSTNSHGGGKIFSHFHRSKSESHSSRTQSGGAGGIGQDGGGGFEITVQRETVVTQS